MSEDIKNGYSFMDNYSPEKQACFFIGIAKWMKEKDDKEILKTFEAINSEMSYEAMHVLEDGQFDICYIDTRDDLIQ